jgi:hypothetical protein
MLSCECDWVHRVVSFGAGIRTATLRVCHQSRLRVPGNSAL